MPKIKKLTVLSLSAVCLLASCNNKTVSADAAKQFIKDNYTGTDTYKGIDSVQLTYKVSCTDDLKEMMVEIVRGFATDVKCGEKEYKDGSLSFTCQKVSKDSNFFKTVLNTVSSRLESSKVDDIEAEVKDGGQSIYTISGAELSIYEKVEDSNEEYKSKYKNESTQIFANNGHLRYLREQMHTSADQSEVTTTKMYVVTLAQ